MRGCRFFILTANAPPSQTPRTSSGDRPLHLYPVPSADSLRCREIRPCEIRRSPTFDSDLKTDTQIVLLFFSPSRDSSMRTSTPSAQRFLCSLAAILAVVAIASAPSATADGPKRFTGQFEGILQTDGYAAYDQIGGPGMVHGACWSHA